MFDIQNFAKEAGQHEEQEVIQAATDISRKAGKVGSSVRKSATSKSPRLHEEAEKQPTSESNNIDESETDEGDGHTEMEEAVIGEES